jgi:hypothetical protein
MVWWGREDSNLQPSGYERATLPEKVGNGLHEVPVSMSVIGGKADTNCQDGRGS